LNYRIYTDSRCTCLYVSAHRIAPCELPELKPALSDDPITKDTFFCAGGGEYLVERILVVDQSVLGEYHGDFGHNAVRYSPGRANRLRYADIRQTCRLSRMWRQD
jgi:hypothetical protein